MRISLVRDNMFVIYKDYGVLYTFNEEDATDFSNYQVEDFERIKERIEEKEKCSLDISYQHN